MKYSNEVVIQKPLSKVLELFDNSENMFEWMEGLKKVTPLTKEQGKVHSKMEMYFELGKRKMHIVETILEKNLPQKMCFEYKSIGMKNWVEIQFQEIDEQQTKYISENKFEFKGLFWLMQFFMKNTFIKQSQKYLNDFKTFAEKK